MQSLKTSGNATKELLRDFYRVCRSRKHIWSIGIYTGETPLSLVPSKHTINPVLTARDVTDVKAEFVADPFMIRADLEANLEENSTAPSHPYRATQPNWYMFFEVLDKADDKGKIGLATSVNGYHWNYERLVLEEPFHLSYPYVFKWENDYYMIPETYQANAVRLYKAAGFPYEWKFEATLIDNECYVDSSLCYFNDYWWLFTSSINWDTLHLYYAKTLTGPWQKHPKSPLITGDKSTARPGGRAIVLNNKIIRYAQDDLHIYGEKVRAFEITELSPTAYAEKEVSDSPILSPSGSGWNAIGMHTVDPHAMDTTVNSDSWIACVDGVQAQSISQWMQSL